MSNITITITSLSTHRTDSIEVSPSTTILELCQYATALLELPSADNIILSKNGKTIYKQTEINGNSAEKMTLSSVGIHNGDLIVVMQSGSNSSSNNSRSAAGSSMPMSTSTAAASGGGGGGLDFSSLLSTMNTPSTSSANSGNSTSNINSSGGGGLQFNLPMLSFGQQMTQTTPVQWDGMTLDDAIARNQNPECFVKVLLDEQRHGNLLKELNYHNPVLANKLKAAGLQVRSFVFDFFHWYDFYWYISC